MSQSASMSLVEAGVNVLVGFAVAVLTQMGVFPLFGLQTSFIQDLRLGAIFTLVSLLRSFLLRRLFERLPLWGERDAAGR
jgi:hypothetical protein